MSRELVSDEEAVLDLDGADHVFGQDHHLLLLWGRHHLLLHRLLMHLPLLVGLLSEVVLLLVVHLVVHLEVRGLPVRHLLHGASSFLFFHLFR